MLVAPELLKAIRRQPCVAHGVLDIFVPEKGLQRNMARAARSTLAPHQALSGRLGMQPSNECAILPHHWEG